ncbi:MAG: hypothetical protein HY421_00885 [Candidatus Kerfeldbacteria bacterium]|nr:hypothetical protein [Candidatus Kerfeldbacteria bacterium]
MSTQDILFIVLAVCAAVLTGFAAWLLYYLVGIFRDLRQTSRAIHAKVEQLSSILDSIRARIGDTVSTLTLLTQVISKVAGSWKARRSKRSSSDLPDE